MSFGLKVSLKQRAEPSAQQKKLNRLIDKIEQQKISLATWQNAQAEIQQHTRQKLMPVYSELHEILFQQLDQLWSLLQQHDFSKADMQQLDDKIAQLAQLLKRSKMLRDEQLKLVKQIDIFYQQQAQQSSKKNKKVQSVKFEQDENSEQSAALEQDEFEQYAAEQQHAREQAKQLRQQQNREQAEQMAAQSLKTVYLKIAAMIHPDREQDETKKEEKTELFQQASQAYEQQDLFYLLKLQLQLEQNKGIGAKEL
ncbi:MAG: molecular chaperone DnaJ, partial [Acinetobacter sp.]